MTACAGAFKSLLLPAVFRAGVIGFLLIAPGAALADCGPAPAGNNAIVVCTGSDTDGFVTIGFDQITVNVDSGASVSNGAFEAIVLDTSNNSAINLRGNSTVSTTGNSAGPILFDGAAIYGDDGAITLNDTAAISTAGNGAYGAFIQGDRGDIILNNGTAISTLGSNSGGAYVFGADGGITLNGTAAISTAGNGANGVLVDGTNGNITLNDGATVSTSGIGGVGAGISGNGAVTIAAAAAVRTTGANTSAVVFFNGANGVNNTLVNNGTVSAANGTAVSGDNISNDIISNYGTIFAGGGNSAILLRGGNDQLTLGTGSSITGTIDGGNGADTATLTGTGSEDDIFLGFEDLVMNGENWSLSGNSSFSNLNVNTGRLAINGAITATGPTTILAAGTLGGSGALSSNVTSAGTIAPGNSVGTLNIVGTLTQTGGAFDVEFDRTGVDRTNVTGAVTLVASPVINIIPLNGAGGASGIFLHSDTSITGAFGAVNYQGNGAATVVQSGNDLNLIVVDGTGVEATNFAALQTGLDYLGTVNDVQLDRHSGCFENTCDFRTGRRVWARGFGRFGVEDAHDGNAGYNYVNAGTALGGDIEIGGGFTLGGSLGYANTRSEVDHRAAEADIDGEFAALSLTYETGPFFVTGIASGGVQQFDLKRRVAATDGTDTARADTNGLLFGGAVQTGFRFDFPGAWHFTPSASVAYQHQSVDGYSEHGAGVGNIKVGDQDSHAYYVSAQLNVARTVAYEDFSLIPHVSLGVADQFNDGSSVAGAFSTGEDLTFAQQDGSRVMGLAGAGMDVAISNGVTINLDYDGLLYEDGNQHAVFAGIAFEL